MIGLNGEFNDVFIEGGVMWVEIDEMVVMIVEANWVIMEIARALSEIDMDEKVVCKCIVVFYVEYDKVSKELEIVIV